MINIVYLLIYNLFENKTFTAFAKRQYLHRRLTFNVNNNLIRKKTFINFKTAHRN